MKILAVEFSTDEAGVALVDGEGRVLASEGVAARNRRSQDLFPAAERVLAAAGAGWGDVGVFAAGTGPGSYTGLRVSVTAARGWALVRGREVWTTSSAGALAAEWLAEHPGETAVGVWGDARRGTVWAGRFERAGRGVRQEGEWAVVKAEEREGLWGGLAWVQSGGEGGRAPKAEWVGRLCAGGGMASGGAEPIYVHAAVNVAPRFDGEGRPVGG